MSRVLNVRYAIVAIFVVSGAAGLVYEVVWSRQLVLVFGNTTQAVCTILTGFFGGMAVGALLGGRVADRVGRPLRLYGLLELMLAVIVIATPLTFRLLHEVYRGAYPALTDTPGAIALLRFALAIIALAPATILMGATLPTLTRYFSRDASRDLSKAFGRLYAANTIGAIFGTALAGFALIELLGLTGALAVGAAGSATAGIVALLLDRRMAREHDGAALAEADPVGSAPAGRVESQAVRPMLALGLVVAFVSGLTSLAYQVVWNRLVSAGTGNSTYVFTAILVLFLLGLAVGALVFNVVRPRIRSIPALVAFGQVAVALLAVGGMLAVIVRQHSAPLNAAVSAEGLAVFVMATSLVVLPPTIMMGLTFPAASALVAGPDGRVATRSGLLLAVNTAGAICGTFLVPFVVIPAVSSPVTLGLIALVNAGVGVVIALVARESSGRPAWSTVVAGGLTFAVITAALGRGGLFVNPTVGSIQDAGGEVYEVTEDEIAPVVAGEIWGHKQLWVAGTSMTVLSVDTKLMPLLPLMVRPDAERALIIAFGMGSSFRTALIAGYRTDAVELVPRVPDMFGHYFDDATAVMADPEGRVIVADGRNHVELTSEAYDVVVVDPPPPIESAGVSVISSLDFYRAAASRLTPGGVMMQWIPYGQSVDELRAHVRSFAAVFEHAAIAFGPGGNGLYMLGSAEPIELEDASIHSVLARPGVLADLSTAFDAPVAGADEWATLIPTLVWIADDAVASFAGIGPLITDDRPYPEYFLLRRLFGSPSPPVTRERLISLTGGATSAAP